jgi:hypothetical protein
MIHWSLDTTGLGPSQIETKKDEMISLLEGMEPGSDPVTTSANLIVSPGRSEKIYDNIKNSRSVYGNKSFSLNSVYIQNEDSAKDVMKWILDKTIRPRKVFEIDTFATAHVQLGDIVKINFDLPEGVKMVDENKKFVVISAQYGRSSSNVKSQLRVMEV